MIIYYHEKIKTYNYKIRCGYDDMCIHAFCSFGMQTEAVISARTDNIKHRQGYVPRRNIGKSDSSHA